MTYQPRTLLWGFCVHFSSQLCWLESSHWDSKCVSKHNDYVCHGKSYSSWMSMRWRGTQPRGGHTHSLTHWFWRHKNMRPHGAAPVAKLEKCISSFIYYSCLIQSPVVWKTRTLRFILLFESMKYTLPSFKALEDFITSNILCKQKNRHCYTFCFAT